MDSQNENLDDFQLMEIQIANINKLQNSIQEVTAHLNNLKKSLEELEQTKLYVKVSDGTTTGVLVKKSEKIQYPGTRHYIV